MARIEHVLSTMLKDSFRELNVIKTKELVLRTGMERSTGRSFVIDLRAVERVDSFKHLGTISDNNDIS